MTYLIGLLLLALVGSAVTIYRLSGERRELVLRIREYETQRHYLVQRNRDLNGELLTLSRRSGMPPNTQTVGSAQPITIPTLPAEHPQKRKPKSIRGKRK